MEIPRTSGDYISETLSNERIQRINTSASKPGLETGPTSFEVRERGQPDQHLEKGPAADFGETIDARTETEARVTWDGPDDPANPKNWSAGRKWLVTFVTSSFSFIAPLSSSMISPALPAISDELQINNGTVELLVVSIYVLGFAIGPLCLGPLSEVYGRRIVLQISNVVFLIFNTACGGCRTTAQMIVFRFLSGLGGSAPLAVGGGTLSDVWSNEERGKAMGIYTLMPLLGPALGPIMAGFIVKYANWRWCFYSVSIGDVLVQLISTMLLQETYPRVILARKAKALREKTGNSSFMTEWEAEGQSLGQKLRTAFKRPIKLITTQPIIQFVAIYMAFLYGMIYLVLSTFPRLWTLKYHEEVHIGSLNYVAVGLGFLTGSQVGTRLQDRIYMALKRRNGGIARPEFRVPLMVPGSILLPIGIFVYAWTAEVTAFWLWPDIGMYIVCGSMILCWQAMQAYLVEAYTTYSASALAAATVLRSLAATGFPLFATRLYDTLGWGRGNSILGGVACVIGWPAVKQTVCVVQEQRRKKVSSDGSPKTPSQMSQNATILDAELSSTTVEALSASSFAPSESHPAFVGEENGLFVHLAPTSMNNLTETEPQTIDGIRVEPSKIDVCFTSRTLKSRIAASDAEISALNRGAHLDDLGPLSALSITIARLQIQSFAFVASASGLDHTDVIQLAEAATATMDLICDLEQTLQISLACPNAIFQGIQLAGCTILKLLKSYPNELSLVGLQEKDMISAFFSAINICKAISVVNNDIPAKVAEIMRQLWSSNNVYRASDGGEILPLQVLNRQSMNVVFDCLYWWRKLFLTQTNSRPSNQHLDSTNAAVVGNMVDGYSEPRQSLFDDWDTWGFDWGFDFSESLHMPTVVNEEISA
ncbi:uncharacterized protein N0V89_008032 [Didymosphaeria variabile]|uniref:Major facilitator superfamily (MFS) profile domain-containing protein n=1 Tax=Didymosphaeria variabile TaxID=1932322 RepID=A0A9W9C8Z6_9PLEO|nr:uncharacterized protein N0V89_008032 [Didymosphaeria variabile]KAJ4349417.1 hypothetical protein N0V89_008032 [Didymosphaeria variabile]